MITKAETTDTTPAPIVIPPLPSIAELSRHSRAIADAFAMFDRAEVEDGVPPKYDLGDLNAIAAERGEAIDMLVLTMTAVTLADVAAQLDAALGVIDGANPDGWPAAARVLRVQVRR